MGLGLRPKATESRLRIQLFFQGQGSGNPVDGTMVCWLRFLPYWNNHIAMIDTQQAFGLQTSLYSESCDDFVVPGLQQEQWYSYRAFTTAHLGSQGSTLRPVPPLIRFCTTTPPPGANDDGGLLRHVPRWEHLLSVAFSAQVDFMETTARAAKSLTFWMALVWPWCSVSRNDQLGTQINLTPLTDVRMKLNRLIT